MPTGVMLALGCQVWGARSDPIIEGQSQLLHALHRLPCQAGRLRDAALVLHWWEACRLVAWYAGR